MKFGKWVDYYIAHEKGWLNFESVEQVKVIKNNNGDAYLAYTHAPAADDRR